MSGSNSSKTYTKSGTYKYKITCKGSAGSVSAEVPIVVSSVPCTYTYAWPGCAKGAKSQTQTYTSSPSGCTGTPSPQVQACVIPCIYTYTWPGCAVGATSQTQIFSSSPSGCTGTSSPQTQACDNNGGGENVDPLAVILSASSTTISLTENPVLKWIINSGTAISCVGTKPSGSDWITTNPYKDIHSGFQTLNNISTTTTYEIKCNDASGSIATSSVKIDVIHPPVCGKIESYTWGACDVTTGKKTGVCTYIVDPSSPPSCVLTGGTSCLNKIVPCTERKSFPVSCEAQVGTLGNIGKVFVGKEMKWYVNPIITATGTYSISYTLTPPTYTGTTHFNYTDIGDTAFIIKNTYSNVGTKNLTIHMEMTDGVGNTYYGDCSTSTIAVPYDGTIIEK